MHSLKPLFTKNKLFLSDLPYTYQHLVRIAYTVIPYGQIAHLYLRNGDLILNHPIEFVSSYRSNKPSETDALPALSPQSEISQAWRKFFTVVARHQSGHVIDLKFRAGNPVSYQVRQLTFLDEIAKAEHWPPYDAAKGINQKNETEKAIN